MKSHLFIIAAVATAALTTSALANGIDSNASPPLCVTNTTLKGKAGGVGIFGTVYAERPGVLIVQAQSLHVCQNHCENSSAWVSISINGKECAMSRSASEKGYDLRAPCVKEVSKADQLTITVKSSNTDAIEDETLAHICYMDFTDRAESAAR